MEESRQIDYGSLRNDINPYNECFGNVYNGPLFVEANKMMKDNIDFRIDDTVNINSNTTNSVLITYNHNSDWLTSHASKANTAVKVKICFGKLSYPFMSIGA